MAVTKKSEWLTDALGLGDVGRGEGMTGPVGETRSEGLAFLHVPENEGFFVLCEQGFVQEYVLVHEFFLYKRLRFRRWSLLRRRRRRRRRRPFSCSAVVAHCSATEEYANWRDLGNSEEWNSRHFSRALIARFLHVQGTWVSHYFFRVIIISRVFFSLFKTIKDKNSDLSILGKNW